MFGHQVTAFIKASVIGHNLTANNTSSAIDLAGYQRVTYLGAATTAAASTVDLKIQECDTSGGTYTDITGAAITQIPASQTGKSFALNGNIAGVRKRFNKTVLTIAGTVSVTIFALFYRGESQPEATPADQVVNY